MQQLKSKIIIILGLFFFPSCSDKKNEFYFNKSNNTVSSLQGLSIKRVLLFGKERFVDNKFNKLGEINSIAIPVNQIFIDKLNIGYEGGILLSEKKPNFIYKISIPRMDSYDEITFYTNSKSEIDSVLSEN
jgi:hypothetical protein